MLTPQLIVVLWLPVSFFVHIVMHEAAHAIMAKLYGGSTYQWQLYPHTTPDGRFVWASVYEFPPVGRQWTDHEADVIAFAPALLDMIWMALAAAATLLAGHFGVQLILLALIAECFAPCFDMTTWAIGMWRERKNTDGEIAESLGWVKWLVPITLVAGTASAVALALQYWSWR